MSEILRILKPNGIFYLTTPNWHYSADTFFNDPTHENLIHSESLEHLLNSFEYKNETFPGLRKNQSGFILANIDFSKVDIYFHLKMKKILFQIS